jgi:MFS family permease
MQLSFGASWTAEWAFTVALGVVAFEQGGTAAVGLVAFVRTVPAAVLSPLGSALADRVRRDHVLFWSCLIRAAATAAAAALLATGSSITSVYALAVVATAAFTVFRPVHSALLPVLCLTPLELTSANVVRGLIDSLSTLLGPLAAAALLGFGSPAAVVVFAAVLSAWSGLLILGLSYEPPPRAAPQPLTRILDETAEGYRALWRYRDARAAVGIGLAQVFTRGCLTVFLVVVALDLLEMGESGVGVLTAAVGAGAVLGSLGVSAFASGRRLAAIEGVGVALWGLPLILSGALPHEPAVLALMCVVGIGNALVDVGLFTLVPRLVPEEMLARAFGAFESLVALFVALGALVTPLVIELLGLRGALAALGLVAPAAVVVAWRRLREVDSSMAPPRRGDRRAQGGRDAATTPDARDREPGDSRRPRGAAPRPARVRSGRAWRALLRDQARPSGGDRRRSPGSDHWTGPLLRRDRAARHRSYRDRSGAHAASPLHPRATPLHSQRRGLPVEQARGGGAHRRTTRVVLAVRRPRRSPALSPHRPAGRAADTLATP